MKKMNLSNEELQKRFDFLTKIKYDIIKLWQTNQPQRGRILLVVSSDFKPSILRFAPGNVKRSTFTDASKGEHHALCEIFWDDTNTKNRLAFGYYEVPSEIQNN